MKMFKLLGLLLLTSLIIGCAAGGESSGSSSSDADREVVPRGFDVQSLNFLECPINGMKLRLAKEGELENLNQAIEDLSLGDLQGQPIRGYLRGLLIREDGKVAYPVKDGQALLTESDAIDMVKRAKSDPNRFNNMGRRE